MDVTPTYSDPIKDIRDFIKNFEPGELLNYLTITAALPGNEICCPRLETLFKIIVSIRNKKFKNSKLTDKDVDQLLEKLDSLYSWNMLEDFTPISLFEYPPLWILGRKYRIFSGVQDRAYEYWKELVADYFPIRENFASYGYDPISIIQEILRLETDLVSFLDRNKTNFRKSGKLFVPPLELAREWKNIIDKWYESTPSKSFFSQYSVSLGRKLDMEKLIEQEPLDTIYKYFSINANDATIQIFQHCNFGFLNSLFVKHYLELHEKDKKIKFDTDFRLYCKLLRLFNRNNILPEFSIKGLESINFGVIFDINKLFLFKIIDGDLCTDLQSEVEKTLKNFQKIDNALARGERNFSINETNCKLPNIRIETIPVIIVKSALPGGHFGIKKDDHYAISKTMWVGAFVDFLSLADDIESGMRFLKFLRRERDLYHTSEVLSFNSLDKYAWYAKNNDSFFQSGQQVGFVSILPGIWDNYFIDKIKQKPDFQPRFEADEPDDYWEVKTIRDRIFQVANSFSKRIAGLFQTNNRLVWILTTIESEDYTRDELRSFNLLTQLIPHRLVQDSSFDDLLQEIGLSPNERFDFVLRPASVIDRFEYSHFTNLTSSVSENNPIVVEGSRNPSNGVVVFFIFYSTEILAKLFENSLAAEKKIIEEILRALISYYNKSQKSTNELLSCYLEKLCKDAKPAFNFGNMQHKLLLPTSSEFYIKTMDSDLSEIQRQTFVYLKKENIVPGVYQEEQAKQIIDKIIDFLNDQIRIRISKYNLETLLPFTINITGGLIQAREIWRYRTITDLKDEREFDPKKDYREQSMEMAMISDSVRHLLETTIKLNPDSDSILTEENWLEIQALGETLLRAFVVRNTIYYGTGKFQLKINNDYSYLVEHVDVEGIAKHAENYDFELLKPAKKSVNWDERPESVDNFFNQINAAFETEYGVGFQDFLRVLSCCVYFPIEKQTHTTVANETELVEYVKKQWPELDETKIKYALKLGSLSAQDFEKIEIYPTDMRNRMMRLVVKPIPTFERERIKQYVLNSWLIDVSINRWLVNMDQGYLPFKEDFVSSQVLKDKLIEMQHKAADDHEKSIENIVKNHTKFYDIKVDKNEKCFTGLPEPSPGEIDNLSLYPDSKELFLIEAKNLQLNLSPLEIKSEIEKYTKPKDGFFDKLLEKKNFVQKYMEQILRYYKINQKPDGWKIKCLIITRTVPFSVPNSTEVEICQIDDLESKLPSTQT